MIGLHLYRPSLRASGAIAVLFAWVATLGWLGVRQWGESEQATLSTEATLRLAPGTVWYAVYDGSVQIGNAGITLDTLSPGYRISEAVTVETPNGDTLARSTRRTVSWLGATLNLERLHSQFTRNGHEADWSVSVFGDTVRAQFTGPLMTQGQVILDDIPTAATVLPYRLALGGDLPAGRGRSVTLIDSWPLAAANTAVSIGHDSLFRYVDSSRATDNGAHWVVAHYDTVRAYAVTLNGASGPRRVWIDQRGAIAARETVFGTRWIRTDFDLSETEFRKTLPGRVTAILSAMPLIRSFATARVHDTSTAVRRFLVQHRDGSPVDRSLLSLLAGGRQRVIGDTIVVMPGMATPGSRETFSAVADPMIQSRAGAITTLRRQLLPHLGENIDLRALMAAYRKVIAVDTALSAPEDALGTLGRHAGRPDGVARLFVAVLRSAGRQARYVVGVYPTPEALLTHAWVEVWEVRSHQWLAVDPVMGEASASTGLVRLAFAGSSHPEEMLLQLANARLTQLDGREQP